MDRESRYPENNKGADSIVPPGLLHGDASPSTRGTGRIAKLFLIDYSAFLCILGLLLTGIVLWLATDKGSLGDKYFLGWHRHTWGDLHLYFSLAFVSILLVHLVQHWKWIRSVTPRQILQSRQGSGWKAVLVTTAITLGVVFGAFFLVGDAIAPVQGPLGEQSRYGEIRDPGRRFLQSDPNLVGSDTGTSTDQAGISEKRQRRNRGSRSDTPPAP